MASKVGQLSDVEELSIIDELSEVDQLSDANPLSDVARIDFSKTVKVLVGPEKKKFMVHPFMICARSRWFKATLSETRQDVIQSAKLDDCDPAVFNEYLNFVYNQRQAEEGSGRSRRDGRRRMIRCIPDVATDDEYLSRLVLTHELAEYLSDPRSANAIMDTFIRIMEKRGDIPGPSVVSTICQECTESSPMYQYAADCFVCYAKPAALELYRNEVSAHFMFDVAKTWALLMEVTKHDVASLLETHVNERGPKVLAGRCRFHVHDERHPESTCTAPRIWNRSHLSLENTPSGLEMPITENVCVAINRRISSGAGLRFAHGIW